MKEVYFQDKILQEGGLTERYDIAEFVSWVHESCCAEEKMESTEASKFFITSAASKQIPSVTALVQLVTAFSQLMQQRKKAVLTKVSAF